jgi:hypothetical protein
VKVLALDDAVGGELVEVGASVVAPGAHAVGRDEFSADPPLALPAVDAEEARKVARVVNVPVGGRHDEDGAHVVDAAVEGERVDAADLGRDSPIVKHYPQIKNPCFVTCVNSALCS